jgi:hypothetical protein
LKIYLKGLKILQNVLYNEKSLHISVNNIKSLGFLEKALIHFTKASVPLKMSSKSLVIIKKASVSN